MDVYNARGQSRLFKKGNIHMKNKYRKNTLEQGQVNTSVFF